MKTYLVIDAESLIRVLNELMDREGSVIGLNNGVRDLGGRDDGEGGHHAVRELFSDLGDQQRSHASAGTTTQRVSDLESLQAVTAFGLASNNIENLVDKFSSLGVVTLGPVVSYKVSTNIRSRGRVLSLTSTALAEDKVIRAEELTERTSTDCVHGARFEIDEDSTGNIFVAGCLNQVRVGIGDGVR